MTIADGRYSVDVSTDAAALLARLEAAAGQAMSGPLEAAEYRLRLRLFAADVLRHCELRFDEVVTRGSVEIDLAESKPADAIRASDLDAFDIPRARIRLSGPLPPGAREVSWRYDLTATTYRLDVVANGRLETQWLEGGTPAKPAALLEAHGGLHEALRGFKLGFDRILPGGVEQIFLILAIFLTGRRGRALGTELAAFGLAESVALALGSTRTAMSPTRLVGVSPLFAPCVAFSIACLASENLLTRTVGSGRLIRVSVFGFVHGIALASAMPDVTPAASNLLVTLASFAAGIQAGQLGVVVLAILIIGSRVGHEGYRRHVAAPVSAAIGLTGLFWTLQRFPPT